eukprot:CAMPEP_0176431040 /NCGR_PEP_ID=MMETSP0127-20121128/14592_1 /TAXON_ID=938130 /ORGANISM="Platyophrya macrostoma, Strain WH" /LENGTH=246 /DNA_ID=CAMNT_0017813005 /DNA_START=35 /DNA_END=775 /DNA_ORIENTATION=-
MNTTFEPANLCDESSDYQSGGKQSNGRWTKEEHQRFVEAIKNYGKNWKKVEEFVGTRSGAQIRSHAQKFFLRLEKELKHKQNPLKDGQNGNHLPSARKSSEGSISTQNTQAENQIDLERSEEQLKDNLSMNEASENLTESSAGNKSVFSKKVTGTAKAKISGTQSPVQIEVKESKALVKSQDKPSPVDNLHPHELFYNYLMDYFSKYNKTRQNLKLSDMVDLLPEKSTSDEETYEFPVGGKRVKQF